MEKIEKLNLDLDFPKMKLLAIVKIEDCIELNKEINKKICSENPLIYGNKNRSGYAWKLSTVRKIIVNKVIPGKQGIWNYDL